MEKIKWPLCADVFTFKDKLKISKFLFTERIWTYGEWIRKYESEWEKVWHSNHVIMVSSGSAANELIALRRKWELQQSGEWPKKNKVLFPVNTWISSVSVWINCGFEPVFIDINKETLNVHSHKLPEIFNSDDSIGTFFYTSILGFFGDILNCYYLCENFKVKFLMDNCEATFSYYWDNVLYRNSIMNLATSSTSLFYSHFAVTGTEGGLIATQSDEERDWFVMMRSHGLTRGMDKKYKNPKVNPEFDFALLGSNYRSSNLQAYMGLLDIKRAQKFAMDKRLQLLTLFQNNLDKEKYNTINKHLDSDECIPLAIPVLCKNRDQRIKAETYCKLNGVMTRPIIGGCLTEQTPFLKYGNSKDYPNAMWSHECGFYIGLHKNVTEEMIVELAENISKI